MLIVVGIVLESSTTLNASRNRRGTRGRATRRAPRLNPPARPPRPRPRRSQTAASRRTPRRDRYSPRDAPSRSSPGAGRRRIDRLALGAFYTLVPIRPRSRCERRSLRTLPGASLRPPLAFNPRPRRLSTPTDAFELHPAIRLYRTSLSAKERREEDARTLVAALPFESGIAAAIRGAPRHAPRATSTCTPYHAAITPPRHQRTYP